MTWAAAAQMQEVSGGGVLVYNVDHRPLDIGLPAARFGTTATRASAILHTGGYLLGKATVCVGTTDLNISKSSNQLSKTNFYLRK